VVRPLTDIEDSQDRIGVRVLGATQVNVRIVIVDMEAERTLHSSREIVIGDLHSLHGRDDSTH
jgi:hypothetical protein